MARIGSASMALIVIDTVGSVLTNFLAGKLQGNHILVQVLRYSGSSDR